MEALVNIAYDRISEDIILLYDAMRAYNEAPAPRPDISAVIAAIRGSLAKDSEKAMGHVWSRENSNEGGFSQRGEELDPDEDVYGSNDINSSPSERFGADDGGMVPMGKEPQLWEFARDVVTSLVSDLAVIPLWQVKVSAVAHRGRLPELWPFIGYRKAMMAIINEEGTSSLFRGWGPVCAAGLLRYFRRSKLLYTDYYWKTTHRVTTRFIMRSDSYSRHVNDPEVLAQTYEGFATRILWAGILHPFDLLATRMMTESRPEYATGTASVRHVLKQSGFAGLFLGVRSSILNVLLPFGNWYLLGVPFLIKTRRMLDGMDTVFRAGMGGSLDMVRAILKEEGLAGLFAGYRATLWGIGPAFLSLCGARLLVYVVLGSSRRTSEHRRRRNAHLRHLMTTSHREQQQQQAKLKSSAAK
ncbi:conserved unknown protein [Ectocarpus siliculosus]|uniref:Mitochondrial carrier protein n=1 Tax=Ectocarpus siliculosus TaxID=2880 RepID=D7FRK1_ECTSI|nr:conserved unknown protein [Ectocarpus siliculosus]|eukprot:CBJ30792.1 conserved unknown protein [Ectocarpus siliculosus]